MVTQAQTRRLKMELKHRQDSLRSHGVVSLAAWRGMREMEHKLAAAERTLQAARQQGGGFEMDMALVIAALRQHEADLKTVASEMEELRNEVSRLRSVVRMLDGRAGRSTEWVDEYLDGDGEQEVADLTHIFRDDDR